MRPGFYDREMEFVPPTETDLAPMLKISIAKADNFAGALTAAVEIYLYEFIE